MLVDMRTYAVRPGTMKQHLDLYEKGGLPIQARHLGEPLAYLVAESGALNTFTHLWLYESAADRSAKRGAMESDPDWVAYRKESTQAGYLVSQENRLMVPTSFCSLSKRNEPRGAGS